MADPKSESDGLFAKVLKFVRSPASGWSEHDVPDEAHESGYSRQMLKEMIERKRRNDFVRRREFDMLRKLRRSEVIAGHDPAGRPSFFQSSLPSRPDDRASTLKKIDEIEAQMSQQWWKTKSADPVSTGGLASTGSAPMPPSSRYASPGFGSTRGTAPAPFGDSHGFSVELPLLTPDARVPATAPAPVPVGARFGHMAAEPPTTQPTPLTGRAASGTRPTPLDATADWLRTDFGADGPASVSGFSLSKSVAVDVEELANDAELEDVAVRFAHADDAGAEAALRAMVGPVGARQDHEDTWLALFDFFRATGQQDRFDEVAIEFASRFGRSAPQWVSLRDLGGRPAVAAGAVPAATRSADWIAPAVLTAQSVMTLQAALGRCVQPWRLAWGRLNRIDPAAIEPLSRLLAKWAGEPVRLHFLDAQRLDELLRQQTVSGDPSVAAEWWTLRMDALRVMHRPDDFEMVALDYCVTYEVSPPSWDSPRCHYKSVAADGSDVGVPSLLPGDGFRDSALSSQPASGFSELSLVTRSGMPLQAELSGSLQGDATPVLDRLPAVMAGELLIISCARLVRVDFAAAGSLLNWCTARQAEGCLLHLTDVHRLVGAFFNVVGISGAARISLRRD